MPNSSHPRTWGPHDLRLASALVQYHLMDDHPVIDDSDAALYTADGIRSVADWLEMVGKKEMASIPPQAAIFSSELLRGAVNGGFEGECPVSRDDIKKVAEFLHRLGRSS